MISKTTTRLIAVCVTALLAVSISVSQKIKVYMSVDMEGITGVVHTDQTTVAGGDYGMARRWMTEDVNAAIHGAIDAGATEIVVNDSLWRHEEYHCRRSASRGIAHFRLPQAEGDDGGN
jgi:D-amino peptidase